MTYEKLKEIDSYALFTLLFECWVQLLLPIESILYHNRFSVPVTLYSSLET
jgi:hypothetical protein